ncbi:MAG: DEAD/DEAH box helicase [Gallionella sp.]
MSDSTAFHLLDERIQRYVWAAGWGELRDAQEFAIPLILPANQDVIIAAPTAAGKTEAAFLPALTYLLKTGGLIVYISPLKALINDQFERLDGLCEQLGIAVWRWHGDVSASTKARFLRHPKGVLLITPESLEALLCHRGSSVKAVFAHTAYFVVDELHAFIGSERGKQLQSLLHRIESSVGHRVPRIGLSATLGDMQLAAAFLRADQQVAIVQSTTATAELKISVKGYEEPLVMSQKETPDDEPASPAHIAAHLFHSLRGTNNLVFPNSRREVERYTHLLNQLSQKHRSPKEFFPHHGSLSKELRSETEAALKQHDHPATAICTNTLELGIDIGAVKSVAQIGSPPSVASLRQRLGRSGRRAGEAAILRGYCIEDALNEYSALSDELRLNTVQTISMISLLLEGWLEPPLAQGLHFSTLIQQILSVIAQYGGASIARLYQLLCSAGSPFEGISTAEFAQLIKHLGTRELLMQDASGDLLHGRIGEKLVNHYTFYASFSTDEEFRLVAGGKTLGTLPISQLLEIGQRILFAGKTWRVEAVDDEKKTIYVVHTKGGVPPAFLGSAGRVHSKIRQRSRELLQSTAMPSFLDDTAQRFLKEARKHYARHGLKNHALLDQGNTLFLITWLGDAANEALACLLNHHQCKAHAFGFCIEIQKGSRKLAEFTELLTAIAKQPQPPLDTLLVEVKNLQREKWDWALPDELLRKSYASLYLDLDEAMVWLRAFARQHAEA